MIPKTLLELPTGFVVAPDWLVIAPDQMPMATKSGIITSTNTLITSLTSKTTQAQGKRVGSTTDAEDSELQATEAAVMRYNEFERGYVMGSGKNTVGNTLELEYGDRIAFMGNAIGNNVTIDGEFYILMRTREVVAKLPALNEEQGAEWDKNNVAFRDRVKGDPDTTLPSYKQ